MNVQKYSALLARPQDIAPEDLRDLASILEMYPYFQSARALQLKGLKNQNSFRYNEALKVAAAYTTDRDILFEYITSEAFIQNQISEQILLNSEMVKELPVVSENVSEAVSLEVDRQLKVELKKAEAILNPELFERKEASVSKMVEKVEDRDESPEASLKLQKPLEFTKEETHSFSEWLKLTQARPIVREQKPDSKKPENDQERNFQLIDKFISEQPKLEPKETSGKNTNLAKPYTKASESLMTETLARVYVQQKNYKKAIQAYKILILKNPEKSGFFADQIKAVKKLQEE